MNAREIAIRATRISGMQKLEEVYPLVSYLSLNPPGRVVELGSALGGTFSAWCEIATAYAIIVSVDIEQGEQDCERMRDFAYPHQTTHFVEGDTHDPAIRRRVEDLTIYADLLHIDADHSEAAVRADWEDYSPLVTPGGHVVFHDISDGGPIGQLWDELARRYWNLKFIEANGNDGWGGIGVLENLMPQFRGLVAKDEFVDRANTRGLSQEQVRKRFIRYKDINESSFFAPLTDVVAVAVDYDVSILVALQGVNRSSVF